MLTKLLEWIVGWWWLFLVVLPFVGGCQDVTQQQNVLQFLQEAKAEGHLVLTSDGTLKAGMRQEFFAGADGTTIAFDGGIDFADRVRHVSETTEEP